MMYEDPPSIPMASTTSSIARPNQRAHPKSKGKQRRRRSSRSVRNNDSNDDKWPKITTLIALSMSLLALCNIMSSDTGAIRVYEYTPRMRSGATGDMPALRRSVGNMGSRQSVGETEESRPVRKYTLPTPKAKTPATSQSALETSATKLTTSGSETTTVKTKPTEENKDGKAGQTAKEKPIEIIMTTAKNKNAKTKKKKEIVENKETTSKDKNDDDDDDDDDDTDPSDQTEGKDEEEEQEDKAKRNKDTYDWVAKYKAVNGIKSRKFDEDKGDDEDEDEDAHEDTVDEPLEYPMDLSSFKDNWDGLGTDDKPVFWHVPKSAGTFVKSYLGSCYGKVLADAISVQEQVSGKEIKIIESKGNNKFVNIDTSSIAGIQRAYKIGFAENNLADVTITPFIYEIGVLFTKDTPGRVFALFRNPIDRAVSMFNYLQYAEWEPTYNSDLKSMSLDDYAKSEYIEDNFVTRSLIHKSRGELNNSDVSMAMDIIRRKILVGLTEKLNESIDRFEKFFDWHFHDNTVQEQCRNGLLKVGGNANKQKVKAPDRDSETYQHLAAKNQYDIQIYNYAKRLFKEQEDFVRDKPDDFRLISQR
eukprot:CAMPEP_0172522212 /NCGR_PEP_ID=MMETSP1066-20121228/293000_1 /TAXON_ID=671091 /ORGANISM="Coscinodiscus wailesii, Strain CCMP2513" /LENGTH=587 /DNA_ID=CAMNT_0013305195 /DNA_START=52 /DNA_END=1815 /DNA_ORIENTATION=+